MDPDLIPNPTKKQIALVVFKYMWMPLIVIVVALPLILWQLIWPSDAISDVLSVFLAAIIFAQVVWDITRWIGSMNDPRRSKRPPDPP